MYTLSFTDTSALRGGTGAANLCAQLSELGLVTKDRHRQCQYVVKGARGGSDRQDHIPWRKVTILIRLGRWVEINRVREQYSLIFSNNCSLTRYFQYLDCQQDLKCREPTP